uniref:Uncharacterized protein n=1 Tax=Arabidopsis thaliana TaxID=3702 RepID=Q56Z67_ARATH|nr:hypothetical protein [Arabidopsis thaliana]
MMKMGIEVLKAKLSKGNFSNFKVLSFQFLCSIYLPICLYRGCNNNN